MRVIKFQGKIEKIIAEAEDAIVTARDFCANEKDAVRDVLSDHNIRETDTRNKVWRIAKARADKQWDDFRQQAGVKRRSRPQDWAALAD